ncbi:MAG: toxin-antitoxin system HicB family antitoxin [Betaproteobacteria bacterium]|nr:toxin-antitoxin system HicB family antitoxin [Betaproteobacteria bacterium]
MKSMMYKGYAARVEFDAEDRIFVGHVAGIRDIVGFHGRSVAELERAFKTAVEDYLSACEQLGQEPNKPYSGKLLLRVAPEVHAQAAVAAAIAGKSLNQWAAEQLERAASEAI